MPNGALISDDKWEADVRMERAIVLHIGFLANFNPFIIATQNTAKPNTRSRFQTHLTNDYGRWGDPSRGVYFRV